MKPRLSNGCFFMLLMYFNQFAVGFPGFLCGNADQVGINIQASGEYAEMVSKNVAVLGPLAVTAVCLLMVFCSRKVLYPWLISLFSLVLPLLIYITNIFPG